MLGDEWADTTTSHGRLMFTVLHGLTEFGRTLIRMRTAEGRCCTVARGVKLERKSKLIPHHMNEAIKRRDGGESVRKVACSYNVHRSAIAGGTA